MLAQRPRSRHHTQSLILCSPCGGTLHGMVPPIAFPIACGVTRAVHALFQQVVLFQSFFDPPLAITPAKASEPWVETIHEIHRCASFQVCQLFAAIERIAITPSNGGLLHTSLVCLCSGYSRAGAPCQCRPTSCRMETTQNLAIGDGSSTCSNTQRSMKYYHTSSRARRTAGHSKSLAATSSTHRTFNSSSENAFTFKLFRLHCFMNPSAIVRHNLSVSFLVNSSQCWSTPIVPTFSNFSTRTLG